ncbi:MAG: protein-glutamate O-methyltransferase CheR [Methylococcaceae bacterium]|jgi:chemotaxis protein methyltransferase CheR
MVTTVQAQDLTQTIQQIYGYQISNYDLGFLQRGLIRFGVVQKTQDYDVIKKLLLEDETLIKSYLDLLFINVSEMFRDPSVFYVLRTEIIPYIASYPVIKIWSAGCAYGQEIYSLAIILSELGLYDRCVLYATDIDFDAVDRAHLGRYPIKETLKYFENYYLSGGSQRVSEYFTMEGDFMVVKPNLRRNICFACHNVATDSAFNEFSLVLCRNLLIYFDHQLQQRVLKLFHDSMTTNSFLVLGKFEALNNNAGYQYFNNYKLKERIFRHL